MLYERFGYPSELDVEVDMNRGPHTSHKKTVELHPGTTDRALLPQVSKGRRRRRVPLRRYGFGALTQHADLVTFERVASDAIEALGDLGRFMERGDRLTLNRLSNQLAVRTVRCLVAPNSQEQRDHIAGVVQLLGNVQGRLNNMLLSGRGEDRFLRETEARLVTLLEAAERLPGPSEAIPPRASANIFTQMRGWKRGERGLLPPPGR